MSHPPTLPSAPVTLNQNARTVLAKRYLVKDETGKPVESAFRAPIATVAGEDPLLSLAR